MSERTSVYLVGGGGADLDRGSVLFPVIESLATERGLAVDKVNGLAARDGELWVETWEEQVYDLICCRKLIAEKMRTII